jgi:hypothetical protein
MEMLLLEKIEIMVSLVDLVLSFVLLSYMMQHFGVYLVVLYFKDLAVVSIDFLLLLKDIINKRKRKLMILLEKLLILLTSKNYLKLLKTNVVLQILRLELKTLMI